MPSVHSAAGIIGRKVGMMRLYDGSGRVRGVTAIEVSSNFVTQIRTPDRDGYSAVQIGHPGNRKRVNRPQRGHLRQAGLERETLTRLREYRLEDAGEYTLGQQLTAEQFVPGSYVDVQATSKGRGFQGGVKRHGFAGGPKTHGQSDRHRAPGSVGSGTTPGRVFKGTKMAGRMGNVATAVLNLLVVANDPERNLIFVQGSVPGPNGGLVSVTAGRKPAIADFAPAPLPSVADVEEPEVEVPEEIEAELDENVDVADAVEAIEPDAEIGEEPGDPRDADDVGEVSEAAAEAEEETPPTAELEEEPEAVAADETTTDEADETASGDDEPESSDRAQS